MPDPTRSTSSGTSMGVHHKSTTLPASSHARRPGYLPVDSPRSMGLTATTCIVPSPDTTAYNLVSKSLPSSPGPACHSDIETAYPHGVLSREVYMWAPPGCRARSKHPVVPKVPRALYGLKQSRREKLGPLCAMVFKYCTQSHPNPCVFMGKDSIVAVNIDDILLVGCDAQS